MISVTIVPPPKRTNSWTWVFPAERTHSPGAHKIGAAISSPRIADNNFADTRIFLINGRLSGRPSGSAAEPLASSFVYPSQCFSVVRAKLKPKTSKLIRNIQGTKNAPFPRKNANLTNGTYCRRPPGVGLEFCRLRLKSSSEIEFFSIFQKKWYARNTSPPR